MIKSYFIMFKIVFCFWLKASPIHVNLFLMIESPSPAGEGSTVFPSVLK